MKSNKIQSLGWIEGTEAQRVQGPLLVDENRLLQFGEQSLSDVSHVTF